MTSARDTRDEARLVAALRSARIEDLGPARLELERRRLMAGLAARGSPARGRRRVAAALGFAGAALAAAATALLLLAPPRGGGGESQVTLSGIWRLEPGDAISRGLPVRVEDGGRARLILPGGASIEAAAGTRMALTTEDGSAIRLDYGHAVIAVTPRAASGTFRARTPDAEVLVLGTVFSVTVDTESGTTVRLHEGEVRLLCGDRSIAMEPGHRVVAAATGLLSLGTFGENERDLDADLAPDAVSPHDPGRGSVLATRGVLRSEEERYEEDAPDEGIHRAGEPEHGQPAARPARRGIRPAPIHERVAEEQRQQRHEEVLALTGEAWERAAPADVDLLFRRARSLGRLGRWGEAAEVYRRIARIDHVRRGEAFYLAADALSRAGDFNGSVAMADRAIAAGGINADHAWRVKLGALTGLGRFGDAAEAATTYLASHPAGAHVGEAHFVRGTGLRLERRWKEAAEAYGRFLERGEGPLAVIEDGRFYHGYCMLMSGGRQQGSAILEAYLIDHPYGRHARQARAALGR